MKPLIAYPHEIRNALTNGRGQFRRPMKPQPRLGRYGATHPTNPNGIIGHLPGALGGGDYHVWDIPKSKITGCLTEEAVYLALRHAPYQPGDLLWVRETHWIVPKTAYWHDSTIPHRVSPDGDSWAVYKEGWERCYPCGRRGGCKMPRWASRLTLRVTGVRVERLQEISEEDAQAEGCKRPILKEGPLMNVGTPIESRAHPMTGHYRDAYRALFESIHGPGSWGANPWVTVNEFEVVR